MVEKFFALTLSAMLCALGASAEAQEPVKVPRIGYLSGRYPASDPYAEPFRQGLRELGYIEGQNIAIEYQYAEGKRGRQSELAAELVRLEVDVIVVAGGDGWIQAAKNATETIPIVMTGLGSDPVRAGFVKSLGRPGGNVTGLWNLSRELDGKRLELLKDVVPELVRVAVLYDPAVPGRGEVIESLTLAGRLLGLTVEPREAGTPAGLERMFAALDNERPDALYVLGGNSLIRSNYNRIANFGLKSRLPSLFASPLGLKVGGLLYYGADWRDIYRRAATYVARILKGARPADLPVEQPRKLEMVINLRTAKLIGLTIPQAVLYRAQRVIR